MIEASLTTNALEVVTEFKDFTLKEMRKATKTALRKGAQVLRKNTRNALRRVLKASTHRNPKYNDRLIDAIKYSVDRKGDEAKVHIMGTQKRGSGTFRLRFFEKGTKVRKKDNHNRGKITALNFFRAARQSSKNDVNQAVTQHLILTIKKINERKTQ